LMRLNKLEIKDKKLFARFLNLSRHGLSVYAFENIYIWKGIFAIYWSVIKENLCVFFKDNIGCFMYSAPLGKAVKPPVIEEAFRIMDNFNQNKDVSRIENVEEKELPFYRGLGYAHQEKSGDYLCSRRDLAQLKGNRFKSKRACVNYFIKHYQFEYLFFDLKYGKACLKLYDCWMAQRKCASQDNIYQGMLEDSRICLKILIHDYQNLNITGRVVLIDKEIKGFTFGFKLNKDTFCILYEVTDLSVKGLSQFIFRQFCAELKGYKYINIMDDSGLENLKKVKLSYHPVKLTPAYIINRGHTCDWVQRRPSIGRKDVPG